MTRISASTSAARRSCCYRDPRHDLEELGHLILHTLNVGSVRLVGGYYARQGEASPASWWAVSPRDVAILCSVASSVVWLIRLLTVLRLPQLPCFNWNRSSGSLKSPLLLTSPSERHGGLYRSAVSFHVSTGTRVRAR